jgi:ribonuclease G
MERLVISRDRYQTRVALLEEGRALELYVEPCDRPTLVGNIYKGRVDKVLAGMDAAFVDIGLERNGFLAVDEADAAGGRGGGKKKITALLRGGAEVLVRVIRDPMGGKGPRLSTQMLFVGRHLLYSPVAKISGASRRLDGAERERLRAVCGQLELAQGGVVARTAAEGSSAEAFERELRFLKRVWGRVQQVAGAATAPALVYREAGLAMRAVRDLLGPEFGEVLVDDAQLHRRLVNYLRVVAPEASGRVHLESGGVPLFERYGLEAELRKALAHRVDLPSGGYIVIDHTEALTVVDVNTGSYVRGKRLEDTTLKTNVEACHEIVRQLRLRDVGGIIVIDFIDMSTPANRDAVVSSLKAELATDRTKSYVVEISPLGLVEMTRQNVTPGLHEVLAATCPVCGGEGRVRSESSVLADVERSLRKWARASALAVVCVEVHPRMAALLSAPPAGETGQETGSTVLGELEAETGKRLLLRQARAGVPLDHCALVEE